MKLRSLVITVVVLAVLSAAAYFLQRPVPAPAADTRLGQPLADRAAIEKAAKLRLTDQAKTVTLARQPDGTWRVASYFDLPADFQKLTRFVDDLTDAKIQRLVTTNPDRIARLDFKDTKIELLDSAGKTLWSLTLGKNAETGGGRFVRFDAEQKAYLANLNVWLDAESKNWADSQLLDLKPDDIAAIELPFAAGGPLTVSRAKKEDPWTADKTPAGQKLKPDKISSIVSSLDALRFTDTTDLTEASLAVAKPHSRTFKLTTFDHKTYTIALARKPEEKKLKPPTPSADGKSGPAALGSIVDLAKKTGSAGAEKKTDEKKPLEPEYETIPAGPGFVTIASSDSTAPVNALMQKRAFQVSDYVFTNLPQNAADLFEPAPPPPAPAKPAEKKPGGQPRKP